MEFTPSLSAFQGVIISADSVHSFSKLTSKGGNEDKIEYVIQCIRNFLQTENYLVENRVSEDAIQIVRKFAFYVVINSDLTILEEMVDLDGIDFVIWTIPTIPKCLMCEILWKINLNQFIYEILVFAHPQLALEVTDAFLSNFKYFKPTESIEKIKILSSASYRLICRFLFFKFESNELTHAFNNFQSCLKFYTEPPNEAKLDILSKDDKYQFIGNRLFSMLSLLLECFNVFTSVHKLKPLDFQDIYELTYKEESVVNQESSIIIAECNNNSLLECINNCHILLLDKCKILVMDVSVEIFCAWSEFEENDKSMQQSIGELCYKVHSILCSIASVSDHPVVSMLQQISCKPLNLIEIINKTSANVIVENIHKNDNDSSHWIKALIHRDKICEDLVLLEEITNHLHILNVDECYKLFKIIYNFHTNLSEPNEYILILMIKVFQFCSNSSKQEIVAEHFSNNNFNDSLLTSEFNNTVTEIFNKLIISPDMNLCDILTVFIQSPRKVYAKIFLLASENMHQTDIMLKIMKLLEKYSNHYYYEETNPHVILASKEIINNSLDTDEKQNNFVRFLKLVKTENIIPGHKLLLLVAMPSLHSALSNRNIKNIYVQCKLLQEAYALSELTEYRAPILAMLAQILDTARWKINTFIVLAPFILEIGLKLQIALLNTYESDIPEKESIWLKIKLRNINPLNMYYFRRLWNPPGNTFVEVISGIHIHKDMDMEHLTSWLSQIVYCTTLQEWYNIWDSLTVFGNGNILDIFHDSLLLILMAEKSNHTEASKACLLYCMKNYVAIVRYKFFKQPLNESQVRIILNKFVIMENLISENDAEDFSSVFLPLFAYTSSVKEEPGFDIHSVVKKLKNSIFIDMLSKLFTKITKSQI